MFGADKEKVAVHVNASGAEEDDVQVGETVVVNNDKRKLGVVGAAFLILNKMVGTGIFATPSGIFASTGSVGISLMLWVLGGIITFCGLSVFLEFGLAIPRSGGEKNYLERVYRKPKHLMSCVIAAQMILLVWPSSNALAFGRYTLFAAGVTQDGWAARGLGVALIIVTNVMCAVAPVWSIRLTNVLGIFKAAVLLFVVLAGFAALAGHRQIPNPKNFENAFSIESGDGYGGSGATGIASALLGVIFSYKGWESANYIAGELKNPRKTLALAAPMAVGGVTVLYILANVAFFAAVPKSELAKADVLVSGLFFKNMFGEYAGVRVLPTFVSISNVGTVLALSYSHAHVIHSMGKENLLPYSKLWASTKPFNTPAAAYILQSVIGIIVLIAPPAGPAYSFIINLTTYPTTWTHTFVTGGLLWLQFKKSEKWTSPFHSFVPLTLVYLLANIFLLVVPFIPPAGDPNRNGYPYFLVPVMGTLLLAVGVLYWAVRMKLMPQMGGYKIGEERMVDENGCEYSVLQKVGPGQR